MRKVSVRRGRGARSPRSASSSLVGLLPLVARRLPAVPARLVGSSWSPSSASDPDRLTGQISLGHGAFMAVGGYTTAILVADTASRATRRSRSPAWSPASPGSLFGMPALRLTGLYLALVTFGFAVATPAADQEAGGAHAATPASCCRSTPGGGSTTSPGRSRPAGGRVAAVRGRAGRAFRAVRDSEVAAAASGVDAAAAKTRAFASPRSTRASPARSRDRRDFVCPRRIRSGSRSSCSSRRHRRAADPLALPSAPYCSSSCRCTRRTSSRTTPDVIFGAVLIAVMILLQAGVAPLIKRVVQA